MSDDQDGCESVTVSSGTGLPGCPGPKAVKRLCVCVHTNLYSDKNRENESEVLAQDD